MGDKQIFFCNLPSPMGDMIAGASDTGICFLEWHDRGGVERIKARVEKRYNSQLCEGNNKHLQLLQKELDKYFNGKQKDFSVLLDIKGTPFELLDWRALLAIPYGETRSYGEIAKILGRPKAVRAVGRANGANYISIVIPCHRVINASGGLHGYGGGLWRKKRLLELEAGGEYISFDK